MKRDKPVIGLAGGIGSGKSRAARELEAIGCVVIDSDRLNHEVLEMPGVQEQLCSWWGPSMVTPEGRTDRQGIARIVFGKEEERRKLERLVFPLIERKRAAIIEESLRDPRVQAIVLDSPLLFESGLDRQCDAVVFVEADEAVRLERLSRERHWDQAQLRLREKTQLPLENKRARADYTIDNRGSAERLKPQVEEILKRIVKKHTS